MNTQLHITVSERQIKRQRKKPTVEVSLARVKRMLRRARVKVEKGKSYIIYNCGHIYDAAEDPGIVTYFAGKNRGLRSCPVCISQALLTKYKKCGCGAEHIGKRVQPSECCASCPAARRASGGNTPRHQHKRNAHRADPSRWNCIHRDGCMETYIDYDAIPCKGCRRYKAVEVVSDPKP